MPQVDSIAHRIVHRLFATGPGDAPTVVPIGGVDLVSWRPADGRRNFGDELSRVVVAKMLADLGITPHPVRAAPRRLLAIGSVLHHARAGDTVWGSGTIRSGGLLPKGKTGLDVRAVRGPLTAHELERRGLSCPQIYGDPALLLPQLFPGRFGATRSEETVLVPHFYDLASVQSDPRILSPFEPWEECVERIAAASFVISTSLHGLIVAEAFGVPARWLRLSERVGRFKFDDYAQATGRAALTPARNVAEALALGPDTAAEVDTTALRAAFPADLWLR